MSLPIKIKLPDGFLDRDVRCGYEVSERLKKIWAVEIDLLNELLRVCRKYNIRIQIFGGTLLGAVRHKGFIPWDDDLDVCLPRSEFKKLCEVGSKEFQHPYFFQTAWTDRRYLLPFARLRNSMTTAAVGGSATPDYNNGIYIDIYVMEGYPRTTLGFKLHNLAQMLVVKPVTLYYQNSPRNNKLVERLMRIPRPLIRLFPYGMWLTLYYVVLRMLTPFSDRVGLRHEMSVRARKYWMYKKELESSVLLRFEFLMVPAPAAYDDILERLYGDYMELPDPLERGKWHEGAIRFDPDTPYQEYLTR